jgi:AP2-associated kinase
LKPAPVVGAVFSPQSTAQQQAIPEVERMRRGRLPAVSPQPSAQPAPKSARPNPSPTRVTNGDPFAALDSKAPAAGGDELSNRFPTLDEFSLLHDQGAKFDFDTNSPTATQPGRDLSQRAAEKLADDAFQASAVPISSAVSTSAPAPVPAPTPLPVAASTSASASASQRQSLDASRANVYATAAQDLQVTSPPVKPASAPPKPTEMSRASAIISSTPELQALSSHASQTSDSLYQPAPTRPSMVSTGTMTSTPPPERASSTQYHIYRFPPNDQHRASSVPRQSDSGSISRTQTPTSSRQEAPAMGRVSSYQGQSAGNRHPSSSRPSLEGGRPNPDFLEPLAKTRPQVPLSKPRPVSTHLESNLDYLREKEINPRLAIPQGFTSASPRYPEKELPQPPEPDDGMTITSNVDFLRSMEDSDPKKKDKHAKHTKRSSLTSIGAGTKSIFAGKFGDAFKRF